MDLYSVRYLLVPQVYNWGIYRKNFRLCGCIQPHRGFRLSVTPISSSGPQSGDKAVVKRMPQHEQRISIEGGVTYKRSQKGPEEPHLRIVIRTVCKTRSLEGWNLEQSFQRMPLPKCLLSFGKGCSSKARAD
jgi:hypothetical protein